MRRKGRLWFAFWLLFALAVSAWVVTRDTSGYVAAGRLEESRTSQSVLQAQRTELIRRIRRAESRAVLTPRAESLGLRLPVDSEIVMLQPPDMTKR
jgi:hypothetical protein